MSRRASGKALPQLIRSYLRQGALIDIDGLGNFELDATNQVVFKPTNRPVVFLAYAEEDRAEVRKIYTVLQKAGFEPWMDREKLLPGQNWPRAIERAIEISDFVIGCFSRRSTTKRGYFQCELGYALDMAMRLPLEDVFLVPVRLDECEVPHPIASRVHYVDLFPDWKAGMTKLIESLLLQTAIR